MFKSLLNLNFMSKFIAIFQKKINSTFDHRDDLSFFDGMNVAGYAVGVNEAGDRVLTISVGSDSPSEIAAHISSRHLANGFECIAIATNNQR